MAEFTDDLAALLDVEPLSGAETNLLLRAARDIAHGTERKAAPLGSFLIGAAVERLVAGGQPRQAALEAVLAQVVEITPEPGPED